MLMSPVGSIEFFGELMSGTALQRGGGGWGGEACPIDDWIGRQCRDRGTSIKAYLILLGGGGNPSLLSGLRGFLELDWTRRIRG